VKIKIIENCDELNGREIIMDGSFENYDELN